LGCGEAWEGGGKGGGGGGREGEGRGGGGREREGRRLASLGPQRSAACDSECGGWPRRRAWDPSDFAAAKNPPPGPGPRWARSLHAEVL
jgi:hypothetical protein